MNEPNLDRFSIRFAEEWQPRPWPKGSIKEPQENEKEREDEQDD